MGVQQHAVRSKYNPFRATQYQISRYYLLLLVKNIALFKQCRHGSTRLIVIELLYMCVHMYKSVMDVFR